MKIYRQGDVLIRRVTKHDYAGAKRIASGIIAQGETTGHAHRISDLELAELYEMGDKMALRVTAAGGVSIVHEEHAPIVLPKGVYEVLIQVQYTPEEVRNIAD